MRHFKNTRHSVAQLLVLGMSASFALPSTAQATVFALDETGNYVLAQGVGANGELADTFTITDLAPDDKDDIIGIAPTSETISGVTADKSAGTVLNDTSNFLSVASPEALSEYEVILFDAAALAQTNLTGAQVSRSSETGLSSLSTASAAQQTADMNIPEVSPTENLKVEMFAEPVKLSVITAPEELASAPLNTMPGFETTSTTSGLDDSNNNSQYDAIIHAEVSKYDNLDVAFVKSVIEAESNYDPLAVSYKGAMGLMQLMPATAKTYNVVNPFSPEQSIRAGTAELSRLMDIYSNPAIALAAYNAGQGAVDQYKGVPPYSETQEYIVRILTKTFAKRDKISKAEAQVKAEEPAAIPDKIFTPMTVQSFDW